MDWDQLGSEQRVHLTSVEGCDSKSLPQRVTLNQGQLDVSCVKNCILFGQDVLGEYACDLEQSKIEEKKVIFWCLLIYLFIGEDSLLRVDLINRPHHLQEEWL